MRTSTWWGRARGWAGARRAAVRRRGGSVVARIVRDLDAAVGPRLRAALVPRVEPLVTPRRAAWAEARRDADALRADLRATATRAEALWARLDRSPFTGGWTVHAAHARHPGVQAVFARHGLPRCPDCAVGADETLAEAAFGEGFGLDALLTELNALPEVFR